MKILFLITFLFHFANVNSQTDKYESDKMILQSLRQSNLIINWHAPLCIDKERLEKTTEENLLRLRGNSFQIASLRSDLYLHKDKDTYKVVYGSKWPMESVINLLMNMVYDNDYKINLRYHLYGNKIENITLPMQIIFDVFAPYMDIYCNVTFINKEEIKAVLVFHNAKRNFIHMLDIKMKTSQLFIKKGR